MRLALKQGWAGLQCEKPKYFGLRLSLVCVNNIHGNDCNLNSVCSRGIHHHFELHAGSEATRFLPVGFRGERSAKLFLLRWRPVDEQREIFQLAMVTRAFWLE